MSATVRRQVDLLVSGPLSRTAIATTFANECRKRRDDVIREGSAPAAFRTFVDGREGAREEDARIGGNVLYLFSLLAPATVFAAAYALARTPSASGRLRSAWAIAVDGQPYVGDLEAIPNAAQVTLVNIAPYFRRIDVGGSKFRGSITEDVRQATRRRFPTINVERIFTNLSPAMSKGGFDVPYILQGHSHRVSSVHNRSRSPRADTGKGTQMTYPAVVLSVIR